MVKLAFSFGNAAPPVTQHRCIGCAFFCDLNIKMHVLTYNLSWASQANVVAGSEADFVRACRAKEINCFDNVLATLKTLREKVDVAGFQEAELDDVIPRLRNSLPDLDSAFRACVWSNDLKKAISTVVMWKSPASLPFP